MGGIVKVIVFAFAMFATVFGAFPFDKMMTSHRRQNPPGAKSNYLAPHFPLSRLTTTSGPIMPTKPSSLSCGNPVVKPHLIATPKIVGGDEVIPGSHPWQISIRHRETDRAFCGGTLLNHQWVLTAAHCFKTVSKPEVFSGYAGKYHKDVKDPTEKRVLFSAIHKHVNYESKTKANDIALLKLTTPLPFDNHILAICLPENEKDLPLDGSMLTATGWGSTSSTEGSSVLRQVKVPLVNFNTCQEQMWQVQAGMLCAGFLKGGKDACKGDSGGPLVLSKPSGQYSLVGVVSWGKGCGEPMQPGVYTNVAYFLKWIHQTMKEN